jgi:hypothetical protein
MEKERPKLIFFCHAPAQREQAARTRALARASLISRQGDDDDEMYGNPSTTQISIPPKKENKAIDLMSQSTDRWIYIMQQGGARGGAYNDHRCPLRFMLKN